MSNPMRGVWASLSVVVLAAVSACSLVRVRVARTGKAGRSPTTWHGPTMATFTSLSRSTRTRLILNCGGLATVSPPACFSGTIPQTARIDLFVVSGG